MSEMPYVHVSVFRSELQLPTSRLKLSTVQWGDHLQIEPVSNGSGFIARGLSTRPVLRKNQIRRLLKEVILTSRSSGSGVCTRGEGQQLRCGPFFAPGQIVLCHCDDQLPYGDRNSRTPAAPRLPFPKQAETFAAPANQGIGFTIVRASCHSKNRESWASVKTHSIARGSIFCGGSIPFLRQI
jgi:hypothetical protein